MPLINVSITELVFRELTARSSAPVQLDTSALAVRSIQIRVRVSTALVVVFVLHPRMASTPVSARVIGFYLTLTGL